MSKLYVVGMPIGNKKDITIRALETLQSVDYIACENTNNTRRILVLHNIKNKKLLAYHNFNEKTSAMGLIKLLENDHDVALVSDAGMPVVSDPGHNIIRECLKREITVEVIPGPSAVTTVLALANFGSDFTFNGFLKPKTIQRQNQLKKLLPGNYIFFVSPHKLIATLKDIEMVFQDKAKLFLGKELTKKFETHYRGTASDVLKALPETIKGEYTLALLI